MKSSSGNIRLSASDLSQHLACRHLTALDLSVALGAREAPGWQSPDRWVLQQRGLAHENSYLRHLQSQGLSVTSLRDIEADERAGEEGMLAMERGDDVIAQATLANGRWFGRADVLRRVALPSRFGNWSYEVYDCKLARDTKAETILQLSLYSELLAAIQGPEPESMYVVPPGNEFRAERYRRLDFAAYYRYVKKRLERAVEEKGQAATYPDPTPHCPICRWWSECDSQRRRDDHLSLVAGISKLQRKQLEAWQTPTVEALAALPVPLQNRPEHGSRESYIRIREQARVQVAGRVEQRPVYELLDLADEHGLRHLPEPTSGDVFFDLEGDPFVGLSGHEYLFGVVTEDASGKTDYECRWAVTPEEEKHAFEWFVDFIMVRWAAYPAMHIYHFAAYEPSAMKKLMGRYATREDEIDRMLRAELFVDLHTIVKRSLRASVEQYSLKALEPFHGYTRALPLEEARRAIRDVEHNLELVLNQDLEEPVRRAVALYNADDCFSTRSLRNWLEEERRSLENAGHAIPRPDLGDGAPPATIDERQQRSAALAERLRQGISVDPRERTDEHNVRWLLSNLLDWHRREAKASYWEYYRLRDLLDEDLLYERSAVAGLRHSERLEIQRKIPTDRYMFDKQETDIRAGDEVCESGERVGTVVAIEVATRTIDIKKTKKSADIHPRSIFVDDRGYSTDVLADALFRLGTWVSANGIDAPGRYKAARDLLLRRPPRLMDGSVTLVLPGETTVQAAKRIGTLLDHCVLAIQGPPGAGKTFTGARMVCELVRQGKRVGITALSHKVIGNLLNEVLIAAPEFALDGLKCVQKVRKDEKPEADPPGVKTTVDNPETLAAFHDGAQVLAGTQWLWSQEDYFESVDVLFVDEAGQMSLANALAVAQAAKSLVLIGDPQQLEQPLKGSHPEGAEASVLEHLLAGAKTISAEKGLFLERTWRLHPDLCSFTSEVFYESRLRSQEGLENQRIEGHPWLGESGLWFIPVPHEGNQNTSAEEVERIAGLIDGLLKQGVNWIDDKGCSRPLALDDVLIVAPYNAQVSDLSSRLPNNARVGTVDRFQGQQAPVVIYSLTTSSPEEAPRGMEFLYSLNRLNVATSRAKGMVLVVGSPRLLEPECRNPRQMQLANALCRYVELARVDETTSRASHVQRP